MELDFTELALLIGTNPLPNYIALKYFTENNKNLKKIWLICSEKNPKINQDSTQEYAESLKEYFSKVNAPLNSTDDLQKLEFSEIIYINDIGSKKTIEEQLKKIAKDSNSRKLHLFFTGGSKAMSAYSYYYLKEKFKNKFSASYLSARDWKIIFDGEENITESIADKIKINFDYLAKMHRFKIAENSENHACISIKSEDFTDIIIKQFIEIIESEKIGEFYSESGGYNRNIFKPDGKCKIMQQIFKNITKEDSNILKAAADVSAQYLKEEENRLKSAEDKSKFNEKVNIFKRILNYRPNETFMKVMESFPEDCRIYYYDDSKNINFQTEIGYKRYNDIVKFLDGFWFEQYVCKVIENNLKNNFDEILSNQILYRKSDAQSNNFELDIVLLKGCQLIGISCTTAGSKHLCKEKGFEIILRTKQIGGAEAKAILITGAEKEIVEKLQAELILESGTVKKNIIVIGKDDWRECALKEKIQEFIN